MSRSPSSSVLVRPFAPGDREAVLALAPRLVVGSAPWRSRQGMLAAARRWLAGSIDGVGADAVVLVAECDDGRVVGVASVARQIHFTGEPEAYLGELAVAEEAEGRGAGRALMAAAEGWAWARGLGVLTLETGAANARARGFYARLGHAEESVRLAKQLGAGTAAPAPRQDASASDGAR